MKKPWIALAALALTAPAAWGVVFLNEVMINPPGSQDDTSEFIELMGTPGKKLDGYAVALMNGGVTKYFTLNSLPASTTQDMEIDEFFSLDGLSLGPNGLLVIGIGQNAPVGMPYPRLLPDTHFQRWNTLWNGGLDTTGKLNNDGSMTIMLIRNRPGATEADPLNPDGLRWGKDIVHDGEITRPVVDPQSGLNRDQFGNGAIDKGDFNSNGVQTLDLRGFLTPDVSDDLEIVDEVSLENDRGWEQDIDSRDVDAGSTVPGLPPRNVHALDDAQGFNPDCITRVDYRTKGPGYAPATGGTGELPNGNNWQDTATEQWLRGDILEGFDDEFNSIALYDNNANANGSAIQPYRVQVPLWLNDGVGVEYDFSQLGTYEVMAGRVNALAVPFIPGDSDRDGDCDADDIAKLAAVFGDDNWIFSNSFAEAPEGKDGDPATQTRPWDVDATGDNGIEPSDLQWTLNFQGNTNGHVVGVRYDSTTPAAGGVVLNNNAGTTCAISLYPVYPDNRPPTGLRFGDRVEITVLGRVTAGANLTAGAENGIMQFVHDLKVSAGNLVRVDAIEPMGGFTFTRPELATPLGLDGDLGIANVNGYRTSFTYGLTTLAPLYRVRLRIIGTGTASLTFQAAESPRFAASTPRGVKLGHTAANGDPANATYPGALTLTSGLPGDVDLDGDVDAADANRFSACMTGPGGTASIDCGKYDLDLDEDVDLDDYAAFNLLAN